ncbi:MAG: dihydrodipicolinate synthase family protein [Acidobacteria bacterium]|nr:dihydrodipicolinate synthase family protein [Acidobacteriota bacterium]MYI75651.1 dihydrodipicolinate synthase family protein [Acidobacteriota bacterium]
MDLRGVFPPIPTPFRDGALDTAALAANCERWMTTGLRGLVVLGSNGEAPLLDDDESDRVIAAARERVPAGRLLIAGVARESTVGTVRAASRAAALGADAVLVRTPSFFRTLLTGDALTRHYTAVADAAPVPVLLYNFTALTGVTLPVAAVARLADHPNIVGMKESGSDIAFISALIDETPDDFSVLAGSAPVFYASLVSGAAGGILALASAVPDLCVHLFDLVAAGRLEEARRLQRRLTPLARLLTLVHGVPGLKAALEIAGYAGGAPRPPLQPAGPTAVAEIRQALEAVHAPA